MNPHRPSARHRHPAKGRLKTQPARLAVSRLLLPCAVALALSACAVGPDFQRPEMPSAASWQAQHNGDALQLPVISDVVLPADWWRAFNDPVLNQLEQRALAAGPDVQTAALRFAQARMQRRGTAAQRGVDVNLQGGVNRQRLSETGASTRMLDALGSGNRDQLAAMLASPYTDYQAGFDASWEPDLWGRIRRSIEAADADVQQQGALLEWAKLSLVSEVAQNYFELRTTQRQISIQREDSAALREQTSLLAARVRRGETSDIDLQRQQSELAAIEARLPALQAQENATIGTLALLLGEAPGALNTLLTANPSTQPADNALPDLNIGLPAEVARRRPDILAAEAALHRATASIGIAQAALYPSIRIGASFGSETYQGSEFGSWGSRVWSVGPSLDLPIFDHGRRVSTVKLRELQQQEAAVNYQQTVLKAWKEIDEALSAYRAEQEQVAALSERHRRAQEAHRLTNSRYRHGMTDFTTVLDSQRTALQARQALTDAQGRLNSRFVAINKAIGNVPDTASAP